MKKIILSLFFGLVMASVVLADVDYTYDADVGVAPWAESCSSEIDEYCTATDTDVYDCMAQHEEFLGDDCFGDYIAFDRGRGIRDEEIRGRWDTMNSSERDEFRTARNIERNHAETQTPYTELHNTFEHSGGGRK